MGKPEERKAIDRELFNLAGLPDGSRQSGCPSLGLEEPASRSSLPMASSCSSVAACLQAPWCEGSGKRETELEHACNCFQAAHKCAGWEMVAPCDCRRVAPAPAGTLCRLAGCARQSPPSGLHRIGGKVMCGTADLGMHAADGNSWARAGNRAVAATPRHGSMCGGRGGGCHHCAGGLGGWHCCALCGGSDMALGGQKFVCSFPCQVEVDVAAAAGHRPHALHGWHLHGWAGGPLCTNDKPSSTPALHFSVTISSCIGSRAWGPGAPGTLHISEPRQRRMQDGLRAHLGVVCSVLGRAVRPFGPMTKGSPGRWHGRRAGMLRHFRVGKTCLRPKML